jgi:hypothetical protein
MLRTQVGIVAVAAALAGTAFAPPAATADELIKDTGFELPVVPTHAAMMFKVGETLGPWVVVGPAQSEEGVYLINEKYTQQRGAAHFAPERGKQFIDLSGHRDTANVGVQQIIETNVGSGYGLTFSIGNEDDSLPNYGAPSAATLFINGVSVGTFSCDVNLSNTTGWCQFEKTFVATTPYTSITFINAGLDNLSGLDDVTVARRQLPPPVR